MVEQRITGPDSSDNGLVLIIDEADSLCERLLESVRRITNLMRDGKPVVSAVLVGGAKIDETLTSPRLESLVQRVTARCYLHPLNSEETRQYIQAGIRACEASAEETITEAAISSIFHATGGVPRLINQMMTEAIDCAAEMEEILIGEHTVDRAWSQLQQLPSPMTDDVELKPHSSAVEFGQLSDMSNMPPMDQAEETERNTQPNEFEEAHEPARLSIEDIADPDLPSVPDAQVLFGEFDQEEDIRSWFKRNSRGRQSVLQSGVGVDVAFGDYQSEPLCK